MEQRYVRARVYALSTFLGLRYCELATKAGASEMAISRKPEEEENKRKAIVAASVTGGSEAADMQHETALRLDVHQQTFCHNYHS
ncbi:hypothetical protein KPH14_003223 [Odynerus spinipes]|uniref:Uncharacterized protein n=1 Tax=Odynerus spinipes TaxID=1348599 RepID=A0AAD9R8L4_9HYME|nr:hypothetical protein KPH14_003223 [Odynerus spinipes]